MVASATDTDVPSSTFLISVEYESSGPVTVAPNRLDVADDVVASMYSVMGSAVVGRMVGPTVSTTVRMRDDVAVSPSPSMAVYRIGTYRRARRHGAARPPCCA